MLLSTGVIPLVSEHPQCLALWCPSIRGHLQKCTKFVELYIGKVINIRWHQLSDLKALKYTKIIRLRLGPTSNGMEGREGRQVGQRRGYDGIEGSSRRKGKGGKRRKGTHPDFCLDLSRRWLYLKVWYDFTSSECCAAWECLRTAGPFSVCKLWSKMCCQAGVVNNINPLQHRMLYSCTHMATVGFKGLTVCPIKVLFQS